MKTEDKDAGTIAVLLERFVKQRLPRAQEIKARVDKGECLDRIDIEFLEQIFKDANENRQYLTRHPEYKDVLSGAAQLYHEIMARALENEKQGNSK
jgi:hypothetical protein